MSNNPQKPKPKTTPRYQLCETAHNRTSEINEWKQFQKLHEKHEYNLRVLEEYREKENFKDDDTSKISDILKEYAKVDNFTEEDVKEIWQYRDMKGRYLGKPCPPELKVKLIFYKDYTCEGEVVELQDNDSTGNQGEHVKIKNEQGELDLYNLSDPISIRFLKHELKKTQ